MKTSAILLAGGSGTRMKSSFPKQFMILNDRPIALFSFDILCHSPEVSEIIVVCAPEYRSLFHTQSKPLAFASPGVRRQDSVFNGFLQTDKESMYICIHDAARPFMTQRILEDVLHAAYQHHASCAAVPMKNTIKQSDESQFVIKTLERSSLWEIQTPQALSRNLVERGFSYIQENPLTITDDVSLAELQGVKAKLVFASYENIKITTPDDLFVSQFLLSR
ncbi:2-C-methyl-D-erythritol 4-phosphate cytidylyltransferase [Chlamydiales bacterium STE3]|nr:2-C-methyl-D-erythritol 4-phosphate cytidylyltransferase [Chlamydiales bacterium STE3]